MTTSSHVMQVEPFGIEPIPDAERNATVLDFIRLQWGGANTLASAMLGAFPILFGLSFQQALLATLLGIIVGALILCPMGIFGPTTGTNNAVSSGAHFGVVGRIVGSFLSLLTAICFFSLSIWSAGDALVGAFCRIVGMQESPWLFALAYGLFALIVLVVCIYGFQFMLLVNKVAVVLASVVFLVGFVAYADKFDPAFAGAGMTSDSPEFWPLFIGATLIVMSNPISFGAFLGDWTRYLPRQTGKGKIMLASIIAQLCTLLPFVFGLVTMAAIAQYAPEYVESANYTGGLLAISPLWFFPLLMLLAVIGGLSTGTTALYGTGLDFSSVFPRLSRTQATILIGVLSIAIIFLGRFAFDLVASVTTLVTLIIVTTTPWMVVMTLGYLHRRGFYCQDDLQRFNRGQEGGIYWFYKGWNLRGMLAWIPSALVALLTVNIPGQFVGPWGELAGGLDISLLVALLLPALIYPLLLKLSPEPAAVFGPAQAEPTAEAPHFANQLSPMPE